MVLVAIIALGLVAMGANFLIVTKPRRWTRLDEKAEKRVHERLSALDREERARKLTRP